MATRKPKTLFLPGAAGRAAFWKPAGLRAGVDGIFIAWPGLGHEPAQADVTGIDDLVLMVLARMTEPVNIVAQSMGGLVALKAALALPDRVARLVLCATSGGVPVSDLGGSDWRADYYAAFPQAGRWIGDAREDLSAVLPKIAAPTLLLWGDNDPISPVAVGQRLCALLPQATLHVITGADHDLALTHSDEVGALIGRHLHAP